MSGNMADYGYFGKGAEGYAHYSQTFKSTFPNSTRSSSQSSYHSTAHSSPSTQVDAAKKKEVELQTTYNQKDYTDPDLENATLNALFAVGMFVLAAVVFIAIVLSL